MADVGGSIAAFFALPEKMSPALPAVSTGCPARTRIASALRPERRTYTTHQSLYRRIYRQSRVIFVCVKGYSIDSITELIKRSPTRHGCNPYSQCHGTVPASNARVPSNGSGWLHLHCRLRVRQREITQMGKIFRLVYGAPRHGCSS